MGPHKKKKEKLRQRLLSERESRRIAQRFESLEKEVHRLLTSGDSIDLQEAGVQKSIATPTPPLPPPPPWSIPGNDDCTITPPIIKYFKRSAQWNYPSSPNRQEGAASTTLAGTSTTVVSVDVLYALLQSSGVTPSHAPHVQVIPRVPLPVTLAVTGMSHVSLDIVENSFDNYLLFYSVYPP